MDKQWWDIYYHDVNKNFMGQMFSCNPIKHPNVTRLERQFFKNFGNSGANAVSLAIHGGAKKVVLLGYDLQKTDGKTHWHGDHVKGLGNATRMDRWPEKFKKLADFAKDCNVVNVTKESALEYFKRETIYQALWQ